MGYAVRTRMNRNKSFTGIINSGKTQYVKNHMVAEYAAEYIPHRSHFINNIINKKKMMILCQFTMKDMMLS